jgi:hypothetical protein
MSESGTRCRYDDDLGFGAVNSSINAIVSEKWKNGDMFLRNFGIYRRVCMESKPRISSSSSSSSSPFSQPWKPHIYKVPWDIRIPLIRSFGTLDAIRILISVPKSRCLVNAVMNLRVLATRISFGVSYLSLTNCRFRMHNRLFIKITSFHRFLFSVFRFCQVFVWVYLGLCPVMSA